MSIVPASRKIPAGLLGIFLGGLGIHKFYLGLNRAGVTMLIIQIVGWCTHWLFGLGYLLSSAMCTIGFVEGIIYLVRNDSDFYNAYMIRRQEWF